MNEYAMFSAGNATNPYESVWHSYKLERNADGKYSIQNAGRAGNAYWLVSDDGKRILNGSLVDGGKAKLEDTDKFVFEIVPVSAK